MLREENMEYKKAIEEVFELMERIDELEQCTSNTSARKLKEVKARLLLKQKHARILDAQN